MTVVYDLRAFLFRELNLHLWFTISGGLVFGIVNIVGNFGTVFCDQAYWQSSVAAKPLQVSFCEIFRVCCKDCTKIAY